jgi:rhomboid protease GluP
MPAFSFKKICPWCVQHEKAQRGELGDDAVQPVMAAPWVQRESTISLTKIIFGANVMVFIAMVIASGPSLDFTNKVMDVFGANFGPYTLSGDYWRLVTYMFLHGGIFHIAMNMWCLWNLGELCESLYGRWTYAAIYLMTGVAGGLASVAWNPRVLSVGASGAIFGLAGALIASIYLGEFSLSGISMRGTLSSLLFFCGFSLFVGGAVSRVDNACHIGGLVSGLILGALIALFAPQQNALRRASVVGVVALALVLSGLGVERWRGGPMRAARAFAAISENDPNRAIAQLQAIIKQQPNLAQAHSALAQAYFQREQFPQAEAEFKRTLELQPQDAESRFNLGVTLLNEQRPEDARVAFTQLLAQDSSSPDAHYGLGLVLANEGRYQPAIDEFKKAAGLSPQFAGAYYEMGHAYFKLTLYDEAIAAYLKEKENSGDQPDLEVGLADAYQAKGMTQQAQDATAKAAQLKNEQR